MIRFNKLPFLATLTLSLSVAIACDGSPPKGGADGACTFRYDPSSTELSWTAFKFTERVGVGGTFDSVKVLNAKSASSPLDAIRGLHFRIDTESVNSKNPERDGRIREHFFGTMKNSSLIEGEVKSLEAGESGSGEIMLAMNGKESLLPVHFKVMKDSGVEVWGTMELKDWEALDSAAALNQVCHDLHTGKDGISKLWPDVEFRIYTRLEKKCP